MAGRHPSTATAKKKEVLGIERRVVPPGTPVRVSVQRSSQYTCPICAQPMSGRPTIYKAKRPFSVKVPVPAPANTHSVPVPAQSGPPITNLTRCSSIMINYTHKHFNAYQPCTYQTLFILNTHFSTYMYAHVMNHWQLSRPKHQTMTPAIVTAMVQV